MYFNSLALKYLAQKFQTSGYKTYQVPEAATITILGGGEIIPTDNTDK